MTRSVIPDRGQKPASPESICGRPPGLQEIERGATWIACDHMSGLLSRSHMTAAKMGSATRTPNIQAMSGAIGSRGLSRVLGSIDHTICSVSSKLPGLSSRTMLALPLNSSSCVHVSTPIRIISFMDGSPCLRSSRPTLWHFDAGFWHTDAAGRGPSTPTPVSARRKLGPGSPSPDMRSGSDVRDDSSFIRSRSAQPVGNSP